MIYSSKMTTSISSEEVIVPIQNSTIEEPQLAGSTTTREVLRVRKNKNNNKKLKKKKNKKVPKIMYSTTPMRGVRNGCLTVVIL